MTIKTINASQLREISAQGIAYTDDDGSDAFIDFEVCFQNFLKQHLTYAAFEEHKSWHLRTSHDTYQKYSNWIMKFKEIGRRNEDGNEDGYLYESDPKSGKPYFVFYDEPLIAIECDNGTEYWKVKDGYEKYGWCTFDMN